MRQMTIAFMVLAALAAAVSAADETVPPIVADSQAVVTAVADDTLAADRIYVSYLHGNRRCATCQKLEAYSAEAVQSGFAKLIEDSSVVWRVVNFEDSANQHYVDDYQLYSQSLVLSRVRNGKEVAWKKLEEIWTLVGDQEKFTAYVQSELGVFIKPAEKQDE